MVYRQTQCRRQVKPATYGHRNEGRFRTSSAAVTVVCGYSKAASTNSSIFPISYSQSRLHGKPNRTLTKHTEIWSEEHIAVELGHQVLNQRENLDLCQIWPFKLELAERYLWVGPALDLESILPFWPDPPRAFAITSLIMVSS